MWGVYIYIYVHTYTLTQWNITLHKRMKFSHLQHVDGPREDCVYWNTSDRKQQILYIITYLESKI